MDSGQGRGRLSRREFSQFVQSIAGGGSSLCKSVTLGGGGRVV